MKNTLITIFIIFATAFLLLGGYYAVQESEKTPTRKSKKKKATSTKKATKTKKQVSTSTGKKNKKQSKAKKRANLIELFKKGRVKTNIEKPAQLAKTLRPWVQSWQQEFPSLSLGNFQFQRQTEFAFPFNEVKYLKKHESIPNLKEARVYSPNGEMYLNTLFHYKRPAFSGVVLHNPEGQNRLYRVAFCNNYCKYHFADWISNKKFVTGSIQEDMRECEKGTPFSKCPETLAYTIYDLETMVATHYTHDSTLGQLKENYFPQAVCSLYAPCEGN